MQVEFLEKIERNLQAENEAYLATLVSETDSSLALEMGDKVLIAEKEVHLSGPVNDKLKTRLSNKLIPAGKNKRQGLLELEICQQNLQFYLQPLQASPNLYIFGAGHVSSPLAKIAELAGFKVVVIDDRQELMTSDRFPEQVSFHQESYQEFLEDFQAQPQDYIVIVTPGHLHDYEVIKNVISQDWKYLGMIGSSRKVNMIFSELQEETGISAEKLKRVDAPIGVDIGSETPEEIAISIAAALVSARRCEN